MHVTVLGFLTFLSSLFIVLGVWQFLWIVIHKKGYEMEKLEGESFCDFLFRYYTDEWTWKLRKKLNIMWFYRSRMFLIFIKIKGVLLILVGLALGLGTFLLTKTEYGIWLNIEF